MSFWPFPKTLLEGLRQGAARGRAVDLGAGDARFARQLLRIEVEPLLVDRAFVEPRAGFESVRADSLRLPFASASLGLLTSANHLRHVPADRMLGQMRETLRCTRGGGRQVIVEDDPSWRDAAEENYRRALRLLARVDPGRGAALGPESVVESGRSAGWAVVSEGVFDNELGVIDPLVPLRWLRSRVEGGDLLDEVGRLEQDVSRSGMSYGRAWYLVLGKEE